jgi:hypothetical protein
MESKRGKVNVESLVEDSRQAKEATKKKQTSSFFSGVFLVRHRSCRATEGFPGFPPFLLLHGSFSTRALESGYREREWNGRGVQRSGRPGKRRLRNPLIARHA